MASARGVVEAKIAGVTRRLRLSLAAVDEIELATDKPMAAVFQSLGKPETLRFGTVLVLLRATCAAGGTPLSEEDEAALMPSDLPDILGALQAVLSAAEGEKDEEEGPAKKKSTPSRSRPRGAAGKK